MRSLRETKFWTVSYRSVKQKWWYKRIPIWNPAPGHDSPFGNSNLNVEWQRLCNNYSCFDIGSQFGSASPWRVCTCQSRVDRDRQLSCWLNYVSAIRKIEQRLDCINVRTVLSQWQRKWSLPSTCNYVSTHKQQNTLQLTSIMKVAVLSCFITPWLRSWPFEKLSF